MNFAKECDSKRLEAVSLYKPKLAAGGSKRKIRLYNLLFLAAYVYQIAWCVSTIGEPYRQFLAKADREGFQVMEGAAKFRAELAHSFQDLDDPERRTGKLGWTAWMDMDIEELAAEKKRDKEKTVLDSLPKHMRVPSKYAAAFWPTLVLGILATLHALVLLMQVWSVAFHVWINYQEVDADTYELPEELLEVDLEEDEQKVVALAAARKSADATTALALSQFPDRSIPVERLPPNGPTHARVVPAKGKHVLLPLEFYPTLGMTFEYHRRRYVYQPESSTWSKIRCRTDVPLKVLHEWKGFPNPTRLVAGQIRFGPNVFSVKQASFGELYKAQLLNPFSVFQIFCVLLWAIDDLLVYSLFSLFMVLMFEGTVVFQRLKSLQALRGMGNPTRLVYVFRSNVWSQIDSTKLLPGDIVSLTRVKPHHAKSDDPKKKSFKIEDDGGDVVPADLLLLRGSTVVNEASLTGESVPQMKEGLTDLPQDEEEALSMKGKHKMNVVYAGTKMMQCKGATDYLGDEDATVRLYNQIPNPPDQGCVCFVLRTGFASAQGKLVRMIEGSQEKVKGHEKETGLLLLLLCIFAIISSSYVLYHGAKNENRSKYELLLHCILIVTSVIRPELPMQMAMAVNNSLMTLMKMHVFCTEPYRVPMAGKLDACLFDKTGTLTTDELVAVGVCEPGKLSSSSTDATELLTVMTKVSGKAALVLAGCHSLLVFEDETTGDPLELASLTSMRWHLSHSTGHAIPAPAKGKHPAGQNIRMPEQAVSQVEVLMRHHFSSKLQRMSCVVKTGTRKYAVAKGSPEAIGRLLANKPDGYETKSQFLSKQGYRVIALAVKTLQDGKAAESAMESRAACEADLEFAGFIAFTCMVRKDTSDVLLRLKQGGMTVAMVTGDALLTAIHVAKEVNICEPLSGFSIKPTDELNTESPEVKALIESKRRQKGLVVEKVTETKKKKKGPVDYKKIAYLETSDKGVLYWKDYEDGSKVQDYVASALPDLAKEYDLATTGKCLALAFEQDDETTRVLEHIKVFARMTPDAKETVIECLHSVGSLCLMCGDGANDVGALKQADVGVALLSGFGNVNADKAGEEEEKTAEKEKADDPPVTAIMSREHLEGIRRLPVALIKGHLRKMGCDPSKYPELVEKEDLVQLYQIKAREYAVKKHDEKNALAKKNMSKAELAQKRKQDMQEKQQRMIQRAQELEAQGVQWASFQAMREMWAEESNRAKAMKGDMAKARGIEGSAATLASQLEKADAGAGDIPMVKLGDASIAAPFTSKMPSIRSCVDIVRQGRCTLVSSMQMYQIMALQCLISSYSLSVLYLDGVKYGDSQMTAMGLLGTVSFMSVSRSKPLDKLSRVRPLSSIFHPARFSSLLGQFAIHLTVMLVAVHEAKKHLPPGYDPDLDGTFKPGILNTVVFLVSSVQQVTVFAVNLQGAPFMTGVTQNRPLLYSLVMTFILTFMFASESVPGLNRYFQLVAFPDTAFRDFILTLLVGDLLSTFAFDRVMQFLFSREILMASVEGTTFKDLFGVLQTIAMCGILMYSFLGNSDQWDEMIAIEEAALNEALGNATEAVVDCIGEACEALNQTVDAIHDEF